MAKAITNNLDLWTSALLNKSSGARGNGKQEAYGIKKLRELILELAVRGRLVPQDMNEEPASELLKKTIGERKRLSQGSTLRDARPPVFPVEPPSHDLPESWVWTSLYQLGEIAPRNDADDFVAASFVPMQAISEQYGVSARHEVRLWGEIKSGFTHFREEDVVLAKITPCFQNGKSAVMRGLTNGFGAGTTELHVFRTIGTCTVPEYVLIYLKSPRFIGGGIPKMTGTAGQKRITRDYFAGNHFPLPPFAEQQRIVAKVDELMALCDQLEQQQTQSIEAHQTLIETLLCTLTRVASRPEQNEAWDRIASHFDTLFTTEQSIHQLQQTILQLAVMGKLDSQDPNDEPASMLLERIAVAREQLVGNGLSRSPRSMPTVDSIDTGGFPLPTGWAWARFEQLINPEFPLSYGVLVPGPDVNSGVPFVRIEDLDIKHPPEKPSKSIAHDVEASYSRTRLVGGEILMGVVGSIGKLGVAPKSWEGANIARAICRIMPTDFVSKEFVVWLLRSDFMQMRFVGNTRTLAQPTLNIGLIRSVLIPLPPVSEQHRIVSKVDELMALCDVLRAHVSNAHTTQIKLADAIVEQFDA